MRLAGLSPTDRARVLARWAAFCLVTAAIWLGYTRWRPPAPILGLRHIEHLNPENSDLSLTFDDAPHPLTTPLLLAALRRTDVKASFFAVGDGLRLYPELAHRIVREGHLLANHSQYHHNLTRVPPAEYGHEVGTCFDAIQAIYQSEHLPLQTRLFRPPGGGLNRDVMQYLYDNNVTMAWWSNNVGDWRRPPAHDIAWGVKTSMHPGDVVLLHDAGPTTPEALPSIVKEARARNLRFVPMPESVDGGR